MAWSRDYDTDAMIPMVIDWNLNKLIFKNHWWLNDNLHEGPCFWWRIVVTDYLPPICNVNSLRPSDAYMCSKLTIIGSDNGLSPDRRQAIIWTNAGILLIDPLGTNFSEILIENHISSFTKTHLKMSSAQCRPSCLGLNVLSAIILRYYCYWCIVLFCLALFRNNWCFLLLYSFTTLLYSSACTCACTSSAYQ